MQVRTYDILNAGPNNRFLCDGGIVSNSGRVFQPQNLTRPTLKDKVIAEGIEALKGGYADLVFDNVMELTSNTVRGCLIAPPARKFCIADLSNIEGRALAWLAGEEWKLQAFRDFDAGVGADLYAVAYAKSFGTTTDVVMDNKKNGDGSMRQVGKVQELALGYQGGVGAFVTFAAVYGINLDDLASMVLDVADPRLIEEATKMHAWFKDKGQDTYGLSPRTFIACDVVKRGWREAHSNVVSWWGQLEAAFRMAIDNPGTLCGAGTVDVIRPVMRSGKASTWTKIVLPSGRALCYPSARIEQDSGQITYFGVNQFNRKWTRLKTYAGKLAENVTQAFARDVLTHNMPAIERDGYEIVLSVHDELITETPDTDAFTSDALAAHMSTVPPWAQGLPLAAAGFETPRYKKD